MFWRTFLVSALMAALASAAELPNPKLLERYKQMLAANPGEGTALDRLWQAYADAGQTGPLLEEYQARGTFAAEMVLGHLLRKAGRPAEAVAAFERAAQLDVKNALPLLAVGALHSAEGRPRDAAQSLERGVALLPAGDPRQGEASMQLGAAWLAAGEREKAAEAWERTVAAEPQNLDLRRRLADTYAQNFLPERGIAHLDYLTANAPPAERATAFQQLSRIHQSAGRQNKAIAALERALAGTAPGNWLRAELQSQLIRLHQRYHRTPELEARWRKTADANPRDLGAQLQLVELYERLGDFEQQRASLEKLTAFAPKNPAYRTRLARLLARTDQLEGAAALFDQLIAEQPGNAELIFERARIDVQREDPQAARRRIGALLASRKTDDALRGKALEFYETHRLHDFVEAHLVEDAAAGGREQVSALANFYFARRREADARRTLTRLLRPGDAAPAQAAAHFQIAQALKTQNDLVAAAEAVAQAITLDGSARDYHLLSAEIETARGAKAAAKQAFEKALAASRTPAEALEVDQKLFECLRQRNQQQPEVEEEPPSYSIKREDRAGASTPELQDYLLALTRAAAEKPTVEAWLRVARWQLWSRSPHVALEGVQQALRLQPDSIAAHEFMVKLTAASDPNPVRAITHLRELIRIDPPNRGSYLRRIGQLELQTGKVPEALHTFQELVRENPGTVDALVDLAQTQQRAEMWQEALVTWRQVHALSPASRKKESVSALLRVFDRLRLPQEAADLLREQMDAQTEEKERAVFFDDLLAHSVRHGLLDSLRAEFEQRRRQRADDYFTEMALGRILKASGRKAEAFDLLSEASYAAPNQADVLPELVREAEELRKLDAAIRLQEQLVRITPQPRAEAFEKLAQLQEKDFRIEDAAKTWERVVAKFPRDVPVLQHAVEFQLKWGSSARATELLRKVRAIEPANLRVLATLASLNLDAGAVAESQECLEEIVRHSPPEARAKGIRYPALRPEDSGRLQDTYLKTMSQRRGRPTAETMRALRGFWVDDKPGTRTEADVRLDAIRDLARLIRSRNDPAALTEWTERWRSAPEPSSETLWAFYYAGAAGPLLDEVQELMSRKPRDAQPKQAFIWLALRTGELDRLSAWLRDRSRTAAERDYLVVALSQHLDAEGGRVGPELIEKLFPEGFRLRLWQVAQLFANRAHFREAARLGQRVFESVSSQRSAFGLELAHWYLYLGEVNAARGVLRETIAQPGEAFDTPVYSALREYYFLLPLEERGAFTESFLGQLNDAAEPVHAAICRTLLYGLKRDEAAAREQLQRVLTLRAIAHVDVSEAGNSATRYWDFVLNAGAQLQSWKFDSLAIHLWEHALLDPALIRLQGQTHGEQVQARVFEVRTRLTALKVAHGDAHDAQALVTDYARHSLNDGLIPLGEALEAIGAHPRSIEVFRQLWQQEPRNPHALRNLLSACRTAGDFDTLEHVLTRCVTEGLYRGNDAAVRDLTLQLIDQLQRRGEYERGRDALDRALSSMPNDARLMLRLAQVHEHAGRLDLAEAIYRRLLGLEPGNAASRLALAAVLERQNRVLIAIEVLEKGAGPEAEAKLAQLQIKADRVDEALTGLERLPPNQPAAALQAATTLVEKGASREARSVIRAALARATDVRAQFSLQTRLIELLDAHDEVPLVAREFRRLRQLAADHADLLGAHFEFVVRDASRLNRGPEVAREVAEEWGTGDGLLATGAALFELQLSKRKDAAGAAATFDQILTRADLNEPVLQRLLAISETSQRHDLTAKVHERLARINPIDFGRMLSWAQALRVSGEEGKAFSVLEELSWRAILNDEIAGRVAQSYAEMSAPERAQPLFEQAVAGDPAARNFRVHLDFARLLVARGDFASAKKRLTAAFRNPANREAGEIISYLAAAGRLDRFETEIADFRLEPARLLAARRAFFGYLDKEGMAAEAITFIEGQPGLVEAGVTLRVRKLAAVGDLFARAAGVLEQLLAEGVASDPALRGELALLYSDWAESQLQSLQLEPAIGHLERAHALNPALYTVAVRLSELHLDNGDRIKAARPLEGFLAVATDPLEKDKARQLLVRIKASS